MDGPRGVLAKAYMNQGVDFGTPDWEENPLFNDLMTDENWMTSTGNSRESQVAKEAPALMNWNITGTIKVRKDDPLYIQVTAARIGGTPIDIMFLSGDMAENGNKGLRCEWMVKKASQDQGTGIGQLYDSVELIPHAFSVEECQTVLITGGVPVFTKF